MQKISAIQKIKSRYITLRHIYENRSNNFINSICCMHIVFVFNQTPYCIISYVYCWSTYSSILFKKDFEMKKITIEKSSILEEGLEINCLTRDELCEKVRELKEEDPESTIRINIKEDE